jgi:hypothetical protein
MSAKGKSTAGFTHTLLPTLRVDDRAWTFHVAGMPSPQTCDQADFIKKVSFRTDLKARRHSLVLSLQPIQSNRAIQDDPLHCYVLISLDDFRPIRPEDGSTEPTGLQLATFKDCTDYAIRFLQAGLTLQGATYNFFGHSNSQLKSRSCFLYAGSKEEVSRKIEAMGDFSTMKTVGKKAKRIGLLFSVAQAIINIATDRVQDIPDIEVGAYIFTDGCGLVAPSLARELARRMRIVFRDRRYTPSVFQIRYRGYKGVVTMDPRMAKEKQPLLKMRKSMKKFNATKDNSFAVVEHSKPYSYGFLNDEHILLLEALGITRETLLRKQDEHFQLLASARTDFREAFRFLSYVNKPELAERLLLDGIESVKPQIAKLIGTEHAKMINKRDEQKCRIFVAKSRLLFGVADAWGVLKEGECHVKVTLEGNGQAQTLTNTEVSVIRNPCLHPGDWQKFRVVQRPELAHLVDCIVFSTKGKRSPADMMSGGDLDGDTFFVTWDPDLVPATLSRPALYPGGRDPVRFGPITDDDRLVYFAKYSNSSLGQVKRLFMNWARAKGPMSAECQELNRLFSQCVDGNRIQIPGKLKTAPSPEPSSPPFVLDYLHERAVESIKTVYPSTEDWNELTTDVVELLVAREDMAISEFQLIQLALRWCRTHSMPFQDLLHYFDFNVLTSEESVWLLAQLPVTSDTPALVNNALCSSNLLDADELRYFNLDNSHLRWKCVYDSSRDRLATFLEAVTANVETFQRKLIVFRPDERLTIAMYVPKKLEHGRDNLVDDSVRLFAFPHSQDREWQSRLVLPTKRTYRLYFDDNILQLFEKQRANSWVFLARPGSDDSDYRNIDDTGDRRRKRQSTVDQKLNFDIRASIALDKFSKGLQRHVGRVNRSAVTAAEIYIISNRDVASMQALDLWLEYVATGEKMSLFSQEPKEFAIPRVEDLLPSSASDSFVQLVRQHELEALALVDSVDDYALAFRVLLELDHRTFLLACFDHLLQNPKVIGADPRPVLYAMVKFLTKAPFLAISFGKPWQASFGVEVLEVLEVSVIPILRAFILSATSVGGLVVEPLKTTLDNIPDSSLSISEFVQLVELVSMTARSPEVAMDLLLECLEKGSGRILSRPAKAIRQTVKSLLGIALNHIAEASEISKQSEELFELKFVSEGDEGCASVDVVFRIDAPGGTPENSSHLRLTVATLPANVHVGTKYSVDGLVTRSQQGSIRVRCLHPLPPYFEQCSWRIENCGSFATTKTTFDALRTLATEREQCCGIAGWLLDLPGPSLPLDLGLPATRNWYAVEKLNTSQNAAIEAALEYPLILMWGPPGTGKTETIVEMICALQEAYHDARILVTAPTHNATDNVLRRYFRRLTEQPLRRQVQPNPLRVSTDVSTAANT